MELNDAVQAVTEFRREGPTNHFHRIRRVILALETDRATRCLLRPSVRGHDQNHMAEVCLAAVVIRQTTVIHDLQQQIENFWMRFFDFVEKQHAVRLFGDGLGQ